MTGESYSKQDLLTTLDSMSETVKTALKGIEAEIEIARYQIADLNTNPEDKARALGLLRDDQAH
jgi:hypothetical protein